MHCEDISSCQNDHSISQTTSPCNINVDCADMCELPLLTIPEYEHCGEPLLLSETKHSPSIMFDDAKHVSKVM